MQAEGNCPLPPIRCPDDWVAHKAYVVIAHICPEVTEGADPKMYLLNCDLWCLCMQYSSSWGKRKGQSTSTLRGGRLVAPHKGSLTIIGSATVSRLIFSFLIMSGKQLPLWMPSVPIPARVAVCGRGADSIALAPYLLQRMRRKQTQKEQLNQEVYFGISIQ